MIELGDLRIGKSTWLPCNHHNYHGALMAITQWYICGWINLEVEHHHGHLDLISTRILARDRGVFRNFSMEGIWIFFVWTWKWGGVGIFLKSRNIQKNQEIIIFVEIMDELNKTRQQTLSKQRCGRLRNIPKNRWWIKKQSETCLNIKSIKLSKSQNNKTFRSHFIARKYFPTYNLHRCNLKFW